jgi:hypothetical protein
MIANIAHIGRHEESILPRLKPPPGVRLRPEAVSGGGGTWKSDAQAQTEMLPMALEVFFAKQLELAGWGRMSGSADEAFAWSSWLIPNSGEWRGVLIVLAALSVSCRNGGRNSRLAGLHMADGLAQSAQPRATRPS